MKSSSINEIMTWEDNYSAAKIATGGERDHPSPIPQIGVTWRGEECNYEFYLDVINQEFQR